MWTNSETKSVVEWTQARQSKKQALQPVQFLEKYPVGHGPSQIRDLLVLGNLVWRILAHSIAPCSYNSQGAKPISPISGLSMMPWTEVLVRATAVSDVTYGVFL